VRRKSSNSTGRSKKNKSSNTEPSPHLMVTGSGDWFCAAALALAYDPVVASKDRNDEVLVASVPAYERPLALKLWVNCS
jgi:hypothetical protein